MLKVNEFRDFTNGFSFPGIEPSAFAVAVGNASHFTILTAKIPTDY
jgi:hypothetical protein